MVDGRNFFAVAFVEAGRAHSPSFIPIPGMERAKSILLRSNINSIGTINYRPRVHLSLNNYRPLPVFATALLRLRLSQLPVSILLCIVFIRQSIAVFFLVLYVP